MADEGGVAPASGAPASAADHEYTTAHEIPQFVQNTSRKSTWTKSVGDIHVSGTQTPMSNFRHSQIPDLSLDSYFVGPRDLDAHSKLPYFLRVHGSVTPRMILPLTLIAIWSSLITCLSKFVYPLAVNTVLLTVLGFVVGLALSFRSSTAYERYSDGRKSWATLSVQSRNLARYIWVHVSERPECAKEDLLSKVTAINLILAFAVSLKHKLRFEPYAHYPDIASLVGHLDTFAKSAHKEENLVVKKKTPWKVVGEYLGLSMANSNPRKAIKRADRPLGNLPLEILTYLSSYVEEVTVNQTLKSAVVQGQILTSLASLTDTASSAERVLTTPLPVGYNILISQIVLLYVYLLPFQLFSALDWVTIPGTIAAAYIILGLAAIGNELENPFGNDVNDLPLDHYCTELAGELDTLMAVPAPRFTRVVRGEEGEGGDNKVFWPLSESGFSTWYQRSESDIRSALRAKVLVSKGLDEGARAKSQDGSGTTFDA
ncbi:probable protein yneE [Phialocephala subalpina]|uniref:Probable protein yneE n=1 Tax=Phialocephala subalpina TaxID=576137 RepID=A0A1L7WIR7_9HELO|nr:probable protein yneE [Phialocephala subalpina]